jgi:hypothetical protein
MAACTPSIHVFLGRPLFRLSSGNHSIINYGIHSSRILLTWPYDCSLFFCMMSMMSGFPFTPLFPLYVHWLIGIIVKRQSKRKMGIKKEKVRKFARRNCHIVLLVMSLALLNTRV